MWYYFSVIFWILYVSLNWGMEMWMYGSSFISLYYKRSVWDVKVRDITTPPLWMDVLALSVEGTEEWACPYLQITAMKDDKLEKQSNIFILLQFVYHMAEMIIISYSSLIIQAVQHVFVLSLFCPESIPTSHTINSELNFLPHQIKEAKRTVNRRAKVWWLPVLCWFGFLSQGKPDAYT